MTTNQDGSRIGYGCPPTATQFKKGYCGNKKGRPRGAQTITKIAARLFDSKVPVRIGEKTSMLPYFVALTRSLKAGAMQGDAKAMRAISELMEALGYYEEKPEPELKGVLVLSGVEPPNMEEWLWCYARSHARAEMRRRRTEAKVAAEKQSLPG
jgi:Family of unknown function (DUF5681)